MKWNFGLKAFTAGLALGCVLVSAIAFTDNKNDAAVKIEHGRVQYQWYPPELPKNLSFAGEKVPLERMPVRERMEKQLLYNTYAHSHILYILQLSTRIFPELQQILQKNGIPDDFKYLCVAESSLENPTSRAGASGYWQFMEATGKQFGLEINNEVDERYNLEKSTEAACKYLKQAYDQFGNWTAAAASYNCGMNGYSNRADFQMSNNYYDLWLPEETNDYIFRILALKLIISHPKKYGFHIPEEDAYQKIPFQIDTIKATIPNLAVYAKTNGTTYKMLRYLNPWLCSQSLTIKENNYYELRLPSADSL